MSLASPSADHQLIIFAGGATQVPIGGDGEGLGPVHVVVSMLNSQPPDRLPPSELKASTTYSDHVPLGLVPLKADKAAVTLVGTGAGEGKLSPAEIFVGRYVPEVSGAADMGMAEESSRVRTKPDTAVEPPTSDSIIVFCPPGPTRSMSTSLGNVWPKPFSLTVTFVTVPVSPATVTFDGYGDAVPELGIVMAAVLAAVVQAVGTSRSRDNFSCSDPTLEAASDRAVFSEKPNKLFFSVSAVLLHAKPAITIAAAIRAVRKYFIWITAPAVVSSDR